MRKPSVSVVERVVDAKVVISGGATCVTRSALVANAPAGPPAHVVSPIQDGRLGLGRLMIPIQVPNHLRCWLLAVMAKFTIRISKG